MRVSRRAIEHIKHFEGLRLTAYRCPRGVLTIGYGSTGPHVREGMVITREQAEDLLRRDLGRFVAGLEEAAGACTQGQFDALVSFAYNVGTPRLMLSTLFRKHKAGDTQGASREFGNWVHAGGVKLEGLVRRRAAKRELYLS